MTNDRNGETLARAIKKLRDDLAWRSPHKGKPMANIVLERELAQAVLKALDERDAP